MNERPSLLDQAGIKDGPNRQQTPAAKGPGLNRNMAKIVGAVVLVLVAIVVMAWGLGLFNTGPAPLPAEEQARRQERFEEQVQEQQQLDARSREPRTEAGG